MFKKSILVLLPALVFLFACNNGKQDMVNQKDEVPAFDSLLAEQLGADDYGMSKYFLAYLKAGPNRTQDSLTAARLQREHLDNITRMAEEGTLVLAGPFLDDGEVRGIYLFNVPTMADAQKIAESDPAVKAGRLILEIHPWYGSAALKQVNEIHKRIGKKGI